MRGDDVAGMAVHIAARVAAFASQVEVWVSPTIPGLVVGGAHVFADRGEHTLRGINAAWRLAAATSA